MERKGKEQQTEIEATTVKPSQVQDELKTIATYTILGGSAGAIWGTVLATHRGQSLPFYATSIGFNFGLASLAFFGTEVLIRKARGNTRDAWGHAAAGGVTGLAMTVPIGGRYRAALAGLVMSGVGFGGYYAQRFARYYLDALGEERLQQRGAQLRGEEGDKKLDQGFAASRTRR